MTLSRPSQAKTYIRPKPACLEAETEAVSKNHEAEAETDAKILSLSFGQFHPILK